MNIRTDVISNVVDDVMKIEPVKEGQVLQIYDALATKKGTVVRNDAGKLFSSPVLTGLTGSNTDNYKLHLKMTGTTTLTVTLYKDRSFSESVASGTVSRTTGGTVNFTQTNSSGVSGSITITAAAEDVAGVSLEYTDIWQRYNGDDTTGQVERVILNGEIDENDMALIAVSCNGAFNKIGKDSVDDIEKIRSMIRAYELRNIYLK